MTLCNATNPPFLEGCVRPLDHLGKHSWVEGENIPPPWIPVPVIHLAVSGMPDGTMEIQHDSGECVFCDAERWRILAGIKGEFGDWGDTISDIEELGTSK
jgi:hypothetical protein